MRKNLLVWFIGLVLLVPYYLQADDIWCDFECAQTNEQYALLSQKIYDNATTVDDWQRIIDYKKNILGLYTHGLHLSVYQNTKDQRIAIVIEGTSATDIEDIITDVVQLTSSPITPKEYTEAREFVQDLRDANSTFENAIITGHSLGGGIAQFIGYSFGMETHTFNPAGLSDTTIDNAKKYYEEHNYTDTKKITNLISHNSDDKRDIVSQTGTLLGEEIFVLVDKDNLIDLHKIKYLYEGIINILK